MRIENYIQTICQFLNFYPVLQVIALAFEISSRNHRINEFLDPAEQLLEWKSLPLKILRKILDVSLSTNYPLIDHVQELWETSST